VQVRRQVVVVDDGGRRKEFVFRVKIAHCIVQFGKKVLSKIAYRQNILPGKKYLHRDLMSLD